MVSNPFAGFVNIIPKSSEYMYEHDLKYNIIRRNVWFCHIFLEMYAEFFIQIFVCSKKNVYPCYVPYLYVIAWNGIGKVVSLGPKASYFKIKYFIFTRYQLKISLRFWHYKNYHESFRASFVCSTLYPILWSGYSTLIRKIRIT